MIRWQNIFLSLSLILASTAQAKIAVIQFVEVKALNLNKDGIIEVLKENNLEFDYYNAQGQITIAKQILSKVMSEKPELIITITTPVTLLAIASRGSSEIPIVFSAVSDPIGAKIIKEDNYKVNLITGASDHPPIEQTFNLLQKLFKAKKIGIIYNNSEANSVSNVNEIKEKYGNSLEINAISINSSSMISSAMNKFIGRVDAIFAPLDSTVFASLELLSKTMLKNNIPVVTNDPDSLKLGVSLGVGFNEYEVGKEAAKKAVRILNAKKNNDRLEDLKISTPKLSEVRINKANIEKLGTIVSDDIKNFVE